MNSDESTEDWLRMYKSITDPDIIEENKRKEQVKARKLAKVADVGL